MQVMPGMTQDQRQAAGDSYRQFQQRLFPGSPWNRQQPSTAPVIGNAPNGRPVTGAITTAQPTKAPDMSAYAPQGGFEAYRPSQAQPKTTSQGTPYGQQPAMPQFDYEGMMSRAQEQMRQYYQQFMPQVAPQPAVPMSAPQGAPRPSQPATPPAPPPSRPDYIVNQQAPQPFTFTIPPAVTSPADLPPEQRPPGFTQTFTDPFGNQTQNNPMAQRDALIQRINEESLPYYMGRPGQFNPNLQELWGQAGDMVDNGWTNPLAGLFG